ATSEIETAGAMRSVKAPPLGGDAGTSQSSEPPPRRPPHSAPSAPAPCICDLSDVRSDARDGPLEFREGALSWLRSALRDPESFLVLPRVSVPERTSSLPVFSVWTLQRFMLACFAVHPE